MWGGIGDSVLDFVNWCTDLNLPYEKIYVIEGDPANFKKCQETIYNSRIRRVELYNCCAGDHDGYISFYSNLGCGSSTYSAYLDKEEKINVQVKSLDNILKDKKCTFLKIDVEGSEMEVLKGAVNTIKHNKPRIAVCVYHRFSDIIMIPDYLLSIVPEYHFYLRRYYADYSETVLYAIAD